MTGGVLKVITDLSAVNSPEAEMIKISPNPVRDMAKISLPATYNKVNITVTGIDGKLIQSSNYTDGQEIILKTSDICPGSYLISIQGDDKLNITKRFMKN